MKLTIKYWSVLLNSFKGTLLALLGAVAIYTFFSFFISFESNFFIQVSVVIVSIIGLLYFESFVFFYKIPRFKGYSNERIKHRARIEKIIAAISSFIFFSFTIVLLHALHVFQLIRESIMNMVQ